MVTINKMVYTFVGKWKSKKFIGIIYGSIEFILDDFNDCEFKDISICVSSDGLHKKYKKDKNIYAGLYCIKNKQIQIVVKALEIEVTYKGLIECRENNNGYKIKGKYECITFGDFGFIKLVSMNL